MIATAVSPNTDQATLTRIFELQKDYAKEIANSSFFVRQEKLKRIKRYLENEENLEALKDAMFADFKKPREEVLLSEAVIVKKHIDFVLSKLRQWMQPKKVSTPLSLTGSSSKIIYEPKGTTLIISPWNYPFQLTMDPLISAIAAGNTAILKPSEMTPNSSAFMQKMIEELFEEKEVAMVQGDASIASALLDMPFDHIFFTGSPQIGKIVMAAAAKNLTSVTLELGGKSPAIIDETVNVKKVAAQTVWGKFLNNGQSCIAPDYIMVHESKKDDFMDAMASSIEKMYRMDGKGIQESHQLSRIVNQKHYQRVAGILQDALDKGARIVYGGEKDETDNYIQPTIITDVTDDMRVMQEEIFGPVMPVIGYSQKEEVVEAIQSRPKPLALYIHSKKKKAIKDFMANTSAGGTTVNDYHLHIGNPALPFGGVNNSGVGKSHGWFGFEAFSNQRAVTTQKFGTLSFIYPPYTSTVKRIMNFMFRYL